MENNLLSTAIYAAQSAGKILLEHFGKLNQMQIVKDYRRDFTTKIDLEAERAIIKIIKKKTPTYSIITEEIGTQKYRSPFTWVIDPLDGTTNYSIGNPFFDVSIALVKEKEPIISVVYAPVVDWLFTAQKGEGAKLNNQKIFVSNNTKLNQCLNSYCQGNDSASIQRMNNIYPKILIKSKDFNRMRAGAYEMALVACGKLGAYLNPGCKSYDVAAGTLLVREAGGKVTDFNNENWDLDAKDILASNGKIHKQILSEINPAKDKKPKISKNKKTKNIMIKH